MPGSYHGDERYVTLLARCRRMRQGATDAEHLLRRLLRGRQIAGAKFRRQHQFGPYILDFFCVAHNLVVEADGGQHTAPEIIGRDEARTANLAAAGIRVLRFTNRQILTETESVVEEIWRVLVGERPSP
jgi:adenine-specific DNA-methyltransferase